MVALGSDGLVFTWGDGTSGSCGHGDTSPVWLPRCIDISLAVTAAACAAVCAEPPHFRSVADDEAATCFDNRIVALVGLSQARRIATRPAALCEGGTLPRALHTEGRGPATCSVTASKTKRADVFSVAPPCSTESRSRPESGKLRCARAFHQADPAHPTSEASDSRASGPARVDSRARVTSIAAGAHHTILLTHEGHAAVMGWAAHGRLGLGLDAAEAISSPHVIPGLPTLCAVACGAAHTLLLAGDGRLYSCGDNGSGQLGVHPGEALSHRRPGVLDLLEVERGGGNEMAKTPEDIGQEAAPGARERLKPLPSRAVRPQQVVGPRGFWDAVIVHIAAGGASSCAVDSAGRLWTWGWGESGCGGDGGDASAWNPRLAARFDHLRVLQASVGPTHAGAIVARGSGGGGSGGRSGGGSAALTPPLPPLLQRSVERMTRARSAALAFAHRQRVIAAARAVLAHQHRGRPKHEPTPIAGHAAGVYAGEGGAASSASLRRLLVVRSPAQAAVERRLFSIRAALAAAPLPPRLIVVAASVAWWESSPDSAAYGAHAAAAMLQRAWRSHCLRSAKESKRSALTTAP
jgi:hypothetical protein